MPKFLLKLAGINRIKNNDEELYNIMQGRMSPSEMNRLFEFVKDNFTDFERKDFIHMCGLKKTPKCYQKYLPILGGSEIVKPTPIPTTTLISAVPNIERPVEVVALPTPKIELKNDNTLTPIDRNALGAPINNIKLSDITRNIDKLNMRDIEADIGDDGDNRVDISIEEKNKRRQEKRDEKKREFDELHDKLEDVMDFIQNQKAPLPVSYNENENIMNLLNNRFNEFEQIMRNYIVDLNKAVTITINSLDKDKDKDLFGYEVKKDQNGTKKEREQPKKKRNGVLFGR